MSLSLSMFVGDTLWGVWGGVILIIIELKYFIKYVLNKLKYLNKDISFGVLFLSHFWGFELENPYESTI